jgi:DNA-binding NarL/FixJ family response regulator
VRVKPSPETNSGPAYPGLREQGNSAAIGHEAPHGQSAHEPHVPKIPHRGRNQEGEIGGITLPGRMLKVIPFVAEGMTNREIGERLGTTELVVKNYLRVIYDRTGMWNRVELALWYESHK